jgi:hypothetical protein
MASTAGVKRRLTLARFGQGFDGKWRPSLVGMNCEDVTIEFPLPRLAWRVTAHVRADKLRSIDRAEIPRRSSTILRSNTIGERTISNNGFG